MSNIFFKTSSGYVDYIRRDGFTINLVNPAFSEDNFKFWSYPYEDYMTDEFKREFQNLALLNKSKTIKKIEGQLNIEGAVYNGTLEIISTDRNMVKKQIDFGSRKLNFTDFNVNELNYGIIDVVNIYNYVDGVLDKTYPEINHCFPRVQTTEFEREENGNVINNCPIINDVFSSNNEEDIYSGLTNIGKIVRPFDIYEYKELINIIKPYIFLLEILKKSFEKLGYTLEGDILNDDDFRFLALDNEGISYEEYKFEELKEITTLSLPLNEEIIKKVKLKTVGGGRLNIKYNANYSETYSDEYGTNTYNVSSVDAEIKVKYKLGETIVEDVINIDAFSSVQYTLYTVEIPLSFSFVEIEVEIKYTLKKHEEGYDYDNIEVQFNPITQKGFQGNLEKNDELKIMKNKLILSEFVPEVAFSDIISFLKSYGYILIPKGNSIYVNKIYLKNEKPKDFTFSEVMFPEIIPKSLDAKIIKLSSYDKLKYGKITITDAGILVNSEKDFINKEEITINSLPLPFAMVKKAIRTYVFEGFKKYVIKRIIEQNVIAEEKEADTPIKLIKYRGVFNKKNDGLDTSYLLPENAINTYFKNDIKFFHSDNIKWSFISSSEEFKNLKEDDKIYAYKRELVIKNLTKTFVGKDMYQIEFDTLSIL
jgi:hypothetical protein